MFSQFQKGFQHAHPFNIYKLSISSGRSCESRLHQLILSWSHLPIAAFLALFHINQQIFSHDQVQIRWQILSLWESVQSGIFRDSFPTEFSPDSTVSWSWTQIRRDWYKLIDSEVTWASTASHNDISLTNSLPAMHRWSCANVTALTTLDTGSAGRSKDIKED